MRGEKGSGIDFQHGDMSKINVRPRGGDDHRNLPIDYRSVVGVVLGPVLNGFTHFVHDSVFINGDAQAGTGWNGTIAVPHRRKGLGQKVMFAVAPFLNHEIGNGCGDLQTGRERAGSVGIVWCQGRVIGLGHPGDDLQFRNASRIIDVRLKNHGRAFLQDFAEPPFEKNAFSGGEWNMGLFGQFGHDIDIKRLHDLFVEPGVIGFEGFYEEGCGGWLHRSVEIDTDVHPVSVFLAKGGEPFHHLIDELLALGVFESLTGGPGPDFYGSHSGYGIGHTIDKGAMAGGTAQQFVNGYAVAFAGNVPEGLVDAGGDGRFYGTAPVKGPAMDGLPVVQDGTRVLAYQVIAHFKGPGSTGFGIVLEHFTPSRDTGVGGNFYENPGVFQDKGFEFGNLDFVFWADGGAFGYGTGGVQAHQGGGSVEHGPEPGPTIEFILDHILKPQIAQMSADDEEN